MTVTFSFITSGLPAGPATYGGIHITRCSDQFWPKAWFLKWPENDPSMRIRSFLGICCSFILMVGLDSSQPQYASLHSQYDEISVPLVVGSWIGLIPICQVRSLYTYCLDYLWQDLASVSMYPLSFRPYHKLNRLDCS